MRIISRSWMTVPIEIRSKAGLLSDTDAMKDGRGSQLLPCLAGSASIKLTTNEIMTMTRSKARGCT